MATVVTAPDVGGGLSTSLGLTIRPFAVGVAAHAGGVQVRVVAKCATRRSEAARPPKTKIGLGRFQVAPIRGNLRTAGVDRNEVRASVGGTCFIQELLKHPL